MTFSQNEKTKRFIRMVNNLLEQGIVKKQVDIGRELEWDTTMLSNVMNGRKNVPNDVFAKFIRLYSIQEDEKKDDYQEKYIEQLQLNCELQQRHNELLDKENNELKGILEKKLRRISDCISINQAYLKSLFNAIHCIRAKVENLPKEYQDDANLELDTFIKENLTSID